MSTPLIELKETSFSAQDKVIVQNITISFEEGTTTALVGPSGGGKSTVLKLAAGLMLPTENDAYFRGQGISSMTRDENLQFRKEAAFVFQDSALWANQTLRQILELPLMIHFPKMTHNQRTSRIVEVLADIGYKKQLDIRPSLLSMGEQKLIAFARALVCSPRILFLDEWTESLDDSAEDRLVAIVKKMNKEGATLIFISHDFKVIKELAQRICMIVDGRLALTASAEEFAHNESLAKMIEKGIAL
jgi:phospholipid/cholesterol/gamma-HCH transport system ATP-binding protein